MKPKWLEEDSEEQVKTTQKNHWKEIGEIIEEGLFIAGTVVALFIFVLWVG